MSFRPSIIIGAGAIGGSLAAEMSLAGMPVLLIARGAHYAKIKDAGLRYRSRAGVQQVAVPVADRLSAARDLGASDVYMCVKSQDTPTLLDELDAIAPREMRLISMQNGVANEAMALRFFPHVFGTVVMIAGTYLEAGEVENPSYPSAGLLDVGAFNPNDREAAAEIAAQLRAASFCSEAVDDIRPWKYAKLLQNLGTPIAAAFAPGPERSEVALRAKLEGERILTAAGIAFTPREVFEARRSVGLQYRADADTSRAGGSVYQSLSRGSSGSEVAYTTGEILMLAHGLGLEAPVNTKVSGLIARLRHQHLAPQSFDAARFLAELPISEPSR